MGDLLSRKQIETRLKSTAGINYTEFSYQLFQAYDWYHLIKNHNCRIQLGGNDQIGNITTGFEFVQALKKHEQMFGLTLPLLTKDGEKLGKSAGNAIWIDSEQLSTFEFYQNFLNTSDQVVESYLKLFTFLPLNEIDDLMKKHRNASHEYLAQRTLAEQLTVLVSGAEGYESAVRCTKVLFGADLESLANMTDNEVDLTFNASKVHKLVFEKTMNVLDVLLKIQAFANVDETLQIIKGNGVSFNYKRIDNPHERIQNAGYILPNNLTLIKVGKKTFHVIKWYKEL
jgi:tyrosyl-tRNA synthetase